MRRNFEIEDNIAVVIDGAYYDLHNDYLFRKMVADVEKDSVTLVWESGHEHRPGISLKFDEIEVFRVNQAEGGYPKGEAMTINIIGFAWPNEN